MSMGVCFASFFSLSLSAIRKIYKVDLKATIKKIEDFTDGGQYLCCSGEKPAEAAKLPPPFNGEA